jgi:ATP phosphoribosyltransferase
MGLRLSIAASFPSGAAEAYPPEDADLASLPLATNATRRLGLAPLHRVLESAIWLIGNRDSIARGKFDAFVDTLMSLGAPANGTSRLLMPLSPAAASRRPVRRSGDGHDVVRIALPDGHQQKHAAAALEAADLRRRHDASVVTRPKSHLSGLAAKVIRQGQQVALGHFDMAICGRDWPLTTFTAFRPARWEGRRSGS